MDPLPIATSCAGLIQAIGDVSSSINTFVRTCRSARGDLDRLSRELHSLKTVLELIQEDAIDESKTVPSTLKEQVSSIVANCDSVVLEAQSCIAKYEDGTRMAWTANEQDDMDKLRASLEAHKSALELALDVFTLILTSDTTAVQDGTARALQEMDQLRARLPKYVAPPDDFTLQKFLEEMTAYIEQMRDEDGNVSPGPLHEHEEKVIHHDPPSYLAACRQQSGSSLPVSSSSISTKQRQCESEIHKPTNNSGQDVTTHKERPALCSVWCWCSCRCCVDDSDDD